MPTKKQAKSMYLQMHMSALWNTPLERGPYCLIFTFGSSYTGNNHGIYFNHNLPILSPLEKCKVIAKYYNQIKVDDGINDITSYTCIEDIDIAYLRLIEKIE